METGKAQSGRGASANRWWPWRWNVAAGGKKARSRYPGFAGDNTRLLAGLRTRYSASGRIIMTHHPRGLAALLYAYLVISQLTVIMVSLSPSVQAAQKLPRAPGTKVINLNRTPGYFTEPSVAINPKNPRQVAVAFQDTAHIAYSFDAGRHWQKAVGVAPPDYRVSGDVSVTYDNKGHAIICYIAFDNLGTSEYWGHGATRNGIYVRRSLDGGKTWEAQDVAVIQHPTTPGIPFEDKSYIVADNSRGPYAGNLYVGWTRWELSDSRLLFSRSTDDGKTWSKPVELDDHPGLPRDDNGGLEGFDGAVGPRGTLYIVWTDGSRIAFTESHDGGSTFSPPRAIIHTAPAFFKVDDVSRSNGFPQIAADSRSGTLYVTWSDYRNGEVDVFCSTSHDHGRTWTPAARVNSDPVHDGSDHFFQWLAVDPVTGAANVIFYDRRGDAENQKQIVVLARSTDGGKSFTNYAWTTKPFDAYGLFIGDYTGLAAFGGRVYGAWTAKLPGTPAPTGKNKGSSELPRSKHKAYWRSHGTIIQVGIADFSRQNRAAHKDKPERYARRGGAS